MPLRISRFSSFFPDLLILIILYLFLASYFPTHLLFSNTTITGGDTASHFYPALYLKEHLIPAGKIMGWDPGSFAGYPLFYFYFPFPFLAMVLLSLAIPFQIAFKIVTISGIFFLPLAAFLAFLISRVPSPGPALAAVSTMPLLFRLEGEIWGGSIASTLTGEFAYALGLVFTLLFIVLFVQGSFKEKHTLINGILLGLIALTHGYSFLFSLVFCLLTFFKFEKWFSRAWYLFRVGVTALMLSAFWLLPALFYSGEATSSSAVWRGKLSEIFPATFYPFLFFILLGSIFHRYLSSQMKKEHFLLIASFLHAGASSITLFLVAYLLGILDIRFLPFLQLILLLGAAFVLALFLAPLKGRGVLAAGCTLLLLAWLSGKTTLLENWIKWNYEGYEAKKGWVVLKAISNELKGTFADPRVTHEDSKENEAFGTLRVFEGLPYFAGRAILEGVHMLSSLSSPFVFFLQGELTRDIQYSIPEYGCFTYNPTRGAAHLRLFNARDLIIRSKSLHNELLNNPEYIYRKKIGSYYLYTVRDNENRYVVPLEYEPVISLSKHWKKISYRWFRLGDDLDVHLVFPRRGQDTSKFSSAVTDEYMTLPRKRIETNCNVSEKISFESIQITTTCINKPLLIKVSYHPNWVVKGARTIYLASPAFMIIYPDSNLVTISFKAGWANYIGFCVTVLGIGFLTLGRKILYKISGLPMFVAQRADIWLSGWRNRWIEWRDRWMRPFLFLRGAGALKCIFVLAVWGVLWFFIPQQEMIRKYNKGMELYSKGAYKTARAIFMTIVRDHSQTGEASNSMFQAAICYKQEGDFIRMMDLLDQFFKDYPDSLLVPEGLYHYGEAILATGHKETAVETWEELIRRFPDSPWSHTARQRMSSFKQ